ncbi:MAG: polysaccharide pyruvyl transferase CsaB [Candidatus Margulisbacteria bacterium]|jgi:polysaccharide pyruvyl transferase CsaB|nr:polysaccharide pyruvyl transferase CsaB [Candidatus Margulisiibacteriota bacterium]
MRVLLSGYYGYNNVGDEAVLESIVIGLRRRVPDVEIAVLSAAPQLTAAYYNVAGVPRGKLRAVWRALRWSDIVISGGGTLFQDVTSARSLWYYLGIVWLAKLFGKKVMVLGQGYGPLNWPFNRFLARWVLNRVDLITVRDTDAETGLRGLGVNRPPLAVTGDPTALLPLPDRAEGRRLLALEGIPLDRPLAGIALRSRRNRTLLSEQSASDLAAALDRLVRDKGVRPVFLLFQCPEDLRQARRISELMQERSEVVFRLCRPAEMLTIVAGLDLLVGMRLHSLIFAALAAVPLIGLTYDPKVRSFLATINQPCLDLNDLSTLSDRIVRSLEQANDIRAKLTGVRESLKRLADRNFELLAARLLK